MKPTSASLNMLKTKEGQVNAVFACFGSAAQHAQFLEDELRRFLAAYNKIARKHFSPEDLEKETPIGLKQTLGALLKQLKGRVKFTETEIVEAMSHALRKRNFLMHHFFLERLRDFGPEEKRLAMLSELVGIQKEFELVTGWIGGLRVATLEAVNGRASSTGSEGVIFTVEIDLPESKGRP